MSEPGPGPGPEPDKTSVVEDTTTCLQTSMKIGKLVFNVSFDETGLSWVKRGKPTDKGVTIPVDEIISLSKITRMTTDGCAVIGFTVCCIRHMKKQILKREMVQFLCDSEDATKWCERIQQAVEHVPARPKRLLVIINPESGSRSGEKVYTSKVAPLFKQANIDTDVMVTERAHHCEEIVSSYDLSSVNGIVLLGGDGFYHEAVNGLQRRLATEAGLDLNSPSSRLPQIPVRIGVIPTGTGNGIAVGSYGCNDVETAALSIIKGQTVKGNLLGVYGQGKFIGVSGVMAGCGIWADAMLAAQEDRGSGRLRYLKVLSNLILKRHRQMHLTCHYRLPTYKSQIQEQVQPKLEQQNEEKSHSDPKTEEKTLIEPASEANPQVEQNKGENPNNEPITELNSHSESHIEENPSSEPNTEGRPVSKSNTEENSSSEPNQEGLQSKQASASQNIDQSGQSNETSTYEDIDQSGQEKPDFEAEPDQLKSDEDTKDTLQEIHDSCNPDWKSTQGVYTGVMVFVGDYWGHKEKTPTVEDCTRLILNNPSGGFKLLLLLMKILTRHAQALESNLTEDMQIKEAKIAVNSPSEEHTENGKLERTIHLDGEIFHLQQPECHIVFHPKTVKLFGAPRESWTSDFD